MVTELSQVLLAADPTGGTGVNTTVLNGALLLALPLALLAGLVSFFSPCVLPLVPGYLSYVTGVGGADLAEARRGRMLGGASLFVLGFTAVFVSTGALFGYFGETLAANKDLISRVLGGLVIVLGLFFMGAIPGLTMREFRFHKPAHAAWSARPFSGALRPRLDPLHGTDPRGRQHALLDQATAGRGALLTTVFCLGLGLPFIATALAFRKALGAFGWVKKHYAWVMRIGGGMLILTGLLLVTGMWSSIVSDMQSWTQGFTVGI